VFFYESSRFLASNNFEDRFVGNGLVLVDRETGSARLLGTALTVECFFLKTKDDDR
jgi:hypothetical protein